MAKTPKTSSSHDDRIRQRAYEIWEQQGSLHGQHDDHWQQASKEIKGSAGSKTAKTEVPATKKTASAKAGRPSSKMQLVTNTAKASKRRKTSAA